MGQEPRLTRDPGLDHEPERRRLYNLLLATVAATIVSEMRRSRPGR